MAPPQPIPYHQQDRDTYCGPAVAMMILAAIGGRSLQQDPLHKLLGDGDNVWATRPDDLLRVLNACSGRPFDVFSRLPGAQVDDVSMGIARRAAAQTPTAALVFGAGHWLVVTGANLAAAIGGTGATVLGFFVNSPSLTPEQPPYQHGVDDKCGSKRAYGSLEVEQYVSYDGWTSDFFTGIEGGTEFVAISGVLAKELPMKAASFKPQPVRSRDGTSGAIFPEDASARAVAGVDLHRLQDGPLRDAFRGVSYGTPQLVQRLYGYFGPYYLVPAIRDDAIVGVVRIDGYTGMFLGAAPVRDGQISAVLLQAQMFVQTDTSESRALFWQPSQQTRSPFEPFLRVVAQDGHVSFLDSELKPFDHPIALRGGW